MYLGFIRAFKGRGIASTAHTYTSSIRCSHPQTVSPSEQEEIVLHMQTF